MTTWGGTEPAGGFEDDRSTSGRSRPDRVRSPLVLLWFVVPLLLLAVFVCFVDAEVADSRIEATVTRYYEALGRGDGATAHDLLCADARARTTEAELSTLLPDHRRPVSGVGARRGTGPTTPVPWNRTGIALLDMRTGGFDISRRIEVRRTSGGLFADGWEVCPAEGTPLLGEMQ